MSGGTVMGLALAMTGYFMYIDQAITPNAVVVCVVIFNAFFGYSWGPIPWLYPPEIMPLPVRAKAVSLSTATNWAFNWIVGEMTPVLQEWIEWRLYPMHAFFCASSVILVYFLYPETKGVPLEEMDAVFGEESAQAASDPNSETSSLVSHVRTDRATRAPSPEPGQEPNYKPPEPSVKPTSLWDRILGRGPQQQYQPVGDDA